MRLSRRAVLGAAALWLLPARRGRAAAAFRGLAAADLLRLHEGRLVPGALDPDVQILAFYFGAGWCGPCRAFVPELKAAYPGLKAARRKVEIVFISDDASPRAMTDYVLQSRMPWLCRRHGANAALQKLRGLALPGLVCIGRDGAVLIDSWVRPGDSRPRQALQRLKRLAAAA